MLFKRKSFSCKFISLNPRIVSPNVLPYLSSTNEQLSNYPSIINEKNIVCYKNAFKHFKKTYLPPESNGICPVGEIIEDGVSLFLDACNEFSSSRDIVAVGMG